MRHATCHFSFDTQHHSIAKNIPARRQRADGDVALAPPRCSWTGSPKRWRSPHLCCKICKNCCGRPQFNALQGRIFPDGLVKQCYRIYMNILQWFICDILRPFLVVKDKKLLHHVRRSLWSWLSHCPDRMTFATHVIPYRCIELLLFFQEHARWKASHVLTGARHARPQGWFQTTSVSTPRSARVKSVTWHMII